MVTLDRRIRGRHAEVAFADSGGDGPAVVLTHGAGLDHSAFEDQYSALTQLGYRIIIWDLRGHGLSTLAHTARFHADDALEDLDAILTATAAVTPVLVGHSLGGNLSQAYADAHPHRVGGVIAIDTTWNHGPLTAGERLGLRLAAPLLSLVPVSRLPALMARASAVSPAAIERATTVFSQMSKRDFIDVWKATTSLVNPDAQRRSPVPLALIRGAADATGNIATAMPQWAAAEGADEFVIADAGHIPMWDAPEETTAVIAQILSGWTGMPAS